MATVAPKVPALARDEAFESLYRSYVKDVYHYALALLRNPADAEDVTQTTFMNAYRAFRRGDEIDKPQNWLIKIAHNVARSRYARMSRRVKEVPLEDHVEHLAAADDERPDVDAVLRALERLPFNQRAALVMRELEGRSYVEISDTLGVSVPAVETLIFRARRSLRVRAAALKSIAGVPLPSSLTQLFGGGGSAVVGGIGGGFLAKAAVVLVAGAFATGVGGADRSDRAVAASGPSSTTRAVTPASHVARSAAKVSKPHATRSTPGPARAAPVVNGPAAAPSATTSPTSNSPAATPAGRTPLTKPLSQPTSVLPPPGPVQTVVQDTVDTTVGTVQQTVEQTVNTVTSALPVSVPQLPVEVPQLPKLPPLP
jgi:RNA polymerase sigma factor (sigma-70 family)